MRIKGIIQRELDYKESWAPKNWCFGTVVLEKTLESPLDCKEIQPAHPKGNESWIFFGRTDAETETPILWPPDMKNWLLGKYPDARKHWTQEVKETTEDEMVGWHHQLDGHEFEQALGVGDVQREAWHVTVHGVEDTTEWLNWTERNQDDLRFSKPLYSLCHLLWLRWVITGDFEHESNIVTCCSTAQPCLTLCNPMDWSTPGFVVLQCLLEFVQTHVHWVGDAIKSSHLLLLSFKPYFFTFLFYLHQEILYLFFTFCHKGGVIYISEVIDISPSNFDSSLWFL